MLGSIFERETLTLPRRSKHFIARVIFAASLFVIVCTAWLLLAGIQPVTNLGDLAHFGSLVFQILAPLQLVVLLCIAALAGVTAVSHEKDRKTLLLLLMTQLTNTEMVIGKMSAGLLTAFNLFFGGLVVLTSLTLFGGVSIYQVVEVGWITAGTIVVCGALGTTIAFWREKTFQALAICILVIVIWLGVAEAIALGFVPAIHPEWAAVMSPFRAIPRSSRPVPLEQSLGLIAPLGWVCGASMFAAGGLLTLLSILRLRVWNPSRESRPVNPESESEPLRGSGIEGDDIIKQTVKDVGRWKARDPRTVWNNPVLWREMCTWAYGKKVLLIRFAYLLLAAMIGLGLYQTILAGEAASKSTLEQELVPDTARLLVPLFVVSLIIINALAVNSITNERDGQALDLLLVTEITPPGFLFGKLLGVLYVAKEMVVVPILLCFWLWFERSMTTENLIFSVLGLLVMDVFVTMLGIHCGMIYTQSRSAIATSLGTVFFLFLGVITCMLIMISFRGSFGRQLAPFLAIILGGGTGLYVALGHRNPSPSHHSCVVRSSVSYLLCHHEFYPSRSRAYCFLVFSQPPMDLRLSR